MKVLYSDTKSNLVVKTMGYNHDHCHHFYQGKTIDVPEKWKDLITEDKKYCFIYKEDEPYVKNER